MAKLTQFFFDLPRENIARRPAIYRDESKLLIVDRKTGKIEHKVFKDIHNYFEEGDTIVSNNSKVFPAKLKGKKEKTGADIEVFLLRELNPETYLWDVSVEPARKIRIGNKLYFKGRGDMTLIAEVVDNTTSRGRTIKFIQESDYKRFQRKIKRLGKPPIPSYMNRDPDRSDKKDYQTIFAKEEGSIAAPAAGLHISTPLLKWFEIKGINMVEITVHIGMGSFNNITVEDLSKHKMDAERFRISSETAKIVNKTLQEEKNVCAVGTTTLRALESSVSANQNLKEADRWTEKFIFPKYDFKIAKSLLTNFHKPKSPFFISTAAFVGRELLLEVYRKAIENKYRFLDYGDAMLVL